jgi:hypothetical protein
VYGFLSDHYTAPKFLRSKFGQQPLKNEEKQGKYPNFSQFSEDLRAENRDGMVATAVRLQSVHELLRVVLLAQNTQRAGAASRSEY